jgi:hypothetical protein
MLKPMDGWSTHRTHLSQDDSGRLRDLALVAREEPSHGVERGLVA